MEIKVGDIVTADFGNSKASNTFIVRYNSFNEKGTSFILAHPLAPEILIERYADELNNEGARLKDSTERSIDYIKANQQLLDRNGLGDLKALCANFVIYRKLTPRHKAVLSTLGGIIAASIFDDDVRDAMSFIKTNVAILDDFNNMWYHNFKKTFNENDQIISKRKRSAIFNIAGFALAELESPSVSK